MKTTTGILLVLATALSGKALAQSQTPDMAVMYTAEHTNYSYGSSLWMQGGALEASAPVRWHLSGVLNFTGEHTGGQSGGSQLSTVALTAGPRYTWTPGGRYTPRFYPQKLHSRLFAEALFGGVHGFDAYFPTPFGPVARFNAFAMQIGGGYDVDIPRGFALRVLDMHYVQTHLPNGSTNIQNNLSLGAGVVYHLHAH